MKITKAIIYENHKELSPPLVCKYFKLHKYMCIKPRGYVICSNMRGNVVFMSFVWTRTSHLSLLILDFGIMFIFLCSDFNSHNLNVHAKYLEESAT